MLDSLDRVSDARKWTLDATAGFRDGAFHLIGPRAYWAYDFCNGIASIEAEHVSRPTEIAYGMCLRYKRRGQDQAPSGYRLLISGKGGWKLMEDDGKAPSDITRWANSKTIRTGEGARNTLEIVAQRELMAIFINGRMIGEVEDASYLDAGGVGPLSTSNRLHIAFRNLNVDPTP